MRGASEASLSSCRHLWETKIPTLDDARASGRELFTLSDSLRSASQVLLRVFADSAVEPAARAQLAAKIYGGKLSAPALELLEHAVSQRWIEVTDLPDAIEALGVDAILGQAQLQDKLSLIEEELYRTVRLLAHERELRVTLSDSYRSVESRVELARKIFARYSPEVIDLVERALTRSKKVTLVATLNSYIQRAADRAQHLLASVTVAQPLNEANLQRLQAILTQRYGREVSVHVVVNPKVIGGMRIHVGEDVIDGTLENRVQAVREALKL